MLKQGSSGCFASRLDLWEDLLLCCSHECEETCTGEKGHKLQNHSISKSQKLPQICSQEVGSFLFLTPTWLLETQEANEDTALNNEASLTHD